MREQLRLLRIAWPKVQGCGPPGAALEGVHLDDLSNLRVSAVC